MNDERTHLDGFMTGPSGGGHRALVLTAFGALAAIFLAFQAWTLGTQPWELDTDSPVASSTGATCDWLRGGQFVLEVGGQRHLCGGAPSQCGALGEESVPVAYDADAPSRCRAAASVDGLSPYEGMTLMLALSLFMGGIAGVSYFASDRVRKAAKANPGSEQDAQAAASRFRLLQRVSWCGLLGAMLAINGTAIAALL